MSGREDTSGARDDIVPAESAGTDRAAGDTALSPLAARWAAVTAPVRRGWSKLPGPIQRWLPRLAMAGAAAMFLALVGLIALYRSVELPAEPVQARTSVVLDTEGNVIADLFNEENRFEAPLEEIAPVAQEAVLAAEDKNFYDHSGLDPLAISRALWNDVRGKQLQGGSTITQQLVKNNYLSPDRSLNRKLKEAVLAVKIEREQSKEEILERYLNTVYFGRGAYGIETAARLYFDSSAADLQLHQAALLAGLIRAPEAAEPDADPNEAMRRRRLVLNAMAAAGFISDDEAGRAEATPLGTIPRKSQEEQLSGSTAYFVAQVRTWAVERFGERVVFGGGLEIHTTLDPRMQAAAEEAVGSVLPLPEDPDAALVALDDRGAVRAMIGGKDYQQSKVNLAMGEAGGGTGRQPGSTFKPMVLAAALESGISVGQVYPGPSEITVDVGGVPFEVENYGGEEYGDLTVAEATTRSVNTIYAQLMAEVGPRSVVDVAHDLGVEAELRAFPALALGSEAVSPLDMARSFMTFGTRGERVTPHLVARVTDADGDVIFTEEAPREQAYPRQYADVVNHVLQGTIENGTGRGADIGRPAAGKTGTTQDYADAWFVGYTPKLSAAVWMGYKEGTEEKMTSVHGRSVTGGSFPAEIWQKFMTVATQGIDTGAFAAPPAELLTTTTSSTTTSSTTSSSTTTSSTTTTRPKATTTTKPKPKNTTTTTTSSTTTTTTAPEEEEEASGPGNGSGGPSG